MFNKKAQVGETVTWFIATIIIFIILVTSIYASSLVAETTKEISIKSIEENEENSNLLLKKTLVSYLLTKNEEIIFKTLSKRNEFDSFSENLASEISEKTINLRNAEFELESGEYSGNKIVAEKIRLNEELNLFITFEDEPTSAI